MGKKELFTVTSLIPRHPCLYFASLSEKLDLIDNISGTKLVLDCNFFILNLHIQLQVSQVFSLDFCRSLSSGCVYFLSNNQNLLGILEMGFEKKEYEFLKEIGIRPRNLGSFANGVWKGTGPLVSSLNPANNQVLSFLFSDYLLFLSVIS